MLHPSIWVLAGIELNFFIVVCMGLCFGFMNENSVDVLGCFSYC